MKCLLAKAMEQNAEEMTEIAQGYPSLKGEMRSLHSALLNQGKQLEDIKRSLKLLSKAHCEEEAKLEIVDD